VYVWKAKTNFRALLENKVLPWEDWNKLAPISKGEIIYEYENLDQIIVKGPYIDDNDDLVGADGRLLSKSFWKGGGRIVQAVDPSWKELCEIVGYWPEGPVGNILIDDESLKEIIRIVEEGINTETIEQNVTNTVMVEVNNAISNFQDILNNFSGMTVVKQAASGGDTTFAPGEAGYPNDHTSVWLHTNMDNGETYLCYQFDPSTIKKVELT